MATAYIGLGANLGDRRATMRAALLALDSQPGLSVDCTNGLASLFETAPVGGPARQPDFLNSAVRIEAGLSAARLLDTLLDVERSLGRRRRQDPVEGAPRLIDLDLLLYDDVVHDDASLTLPHPRLHTRLFVLEPLAEIAVTTVHPVLGVTISALRDRCRLEGLRSSSGGDIDRVVRCHGPDWAAPCEHEPAVHR